MQPQLLVDLLAQTLELFDRQIWHGFSLSSSKPARSPHRILGALAPRKSAPTRAERPFEGILPPQGEPGAPYWTGRQPGTRKRRHWWPKCPEPAPPDIGKAVGLHPQLPPARWAACSRRGLAMGNGGGQR